jgi:hypothetical protein
MRGHLRALSWLALLLALPVQAGSGWTESARIGEIQSDDFGRLVIRLELGSNPSGCREGGWFIREPGPATAQILEVLLTAVRAGRPVRVYVSGVCHLKGYAEISAVSLAP